jgi:hypothetical protein
MRRRTVGKDAGEVHTGKNRRLPDIMGCVAVPSLHAPGIR